MTLPTSGKEANKLRPVTLQVLVCRGEAILSTRTPYVCHVGGARGPNSRPIAKMKAPGIVLQAARGRGHPARWSVSLMKAEGAS
jgi:hypothetical protein